MEQTDQYHISPRETSDFIEGYYEAALFATAAVSEDPAFDERTPYDLCCEVDPESRDRIEASALDFLDSNRRAFYLAGELGHSWERMGHDAFLTREGHGAGFWDGDYPKLLGDHLTARAQSDRTDAYCWIETDGDGVPVVFFENV